MTKCAKFT